MNTNVSSLTIVHRRSMCHIPCSTWGPTTHTAIQLQPHTATTHQALEPVAHYTRLNNYFNKQQSSSPSWTVLERRAHNTIFQISIKSKCWESSYPLPASPSTNLQPSFAFSLFQPFDCQLQRCVSSHGNKHEVGGGNPVDLLRFVFDFWLFQNI